jgi:hypothetical protein
VKIFGLRIPSISRVRRGETGAGTGAGAEDPDVGTEDDTSKAFGAKSKADAPGSLAGAGAPGGHGTPDDAGADGAPNRVESPS